MASDLKSAVRSAIASFVSARDSSDGDISVDVLRAIRDESTLLVERQLICDMLDSDPFELMSEAEDDDGAIAKTIGRAKAMMRVLSCSRCSTAEGYSSINAVIELKNDGKMKNVKDSIRISFSFERQPNSPPDDHDDETGACDQDGPNADSVDPESKEGDEDECRQAGNSSNQTKKRKLNDGTPNPVREPGTIITYKIDFSVDHGKMEQLLVVEVFAIGDHPSVKEAVPLSGMNDSDDEGEWEEIAGDDDVQEKEKKSGDDNGMKVTEGNKEENGDIDEKQQLSGEISDSLRTYTDDENDLDDGRDRFDIFADPENVTKFLERTNLELNECSVFYFLLTFPFYEHEWEIAGFLFSSIFGDADDDSDVESMDEDSVAN